MSPNHPDFSVDEEAFLNKRCRPVQVPGIEVFQDPELLPKDFVKDVAEAGLSPDGLPQPE
ncbi:unnamed protein product, partial [Amoebophrya sp. A120]|eukprot:GSA120T00004976001.1